jgi:hypothetical protein
VNEDLFAICFTSAGLAVAVGDQGRIVESLGIESGWLTAKSGTRARLDDVAPSGAGVVAVGFGGTILLRK